MTTRFPGITILSPASASSCRGRTWWTGAAPFFWNGPTPGCRRNLWASPAPRDGVFRTAEYFEEKTGSPEGILTVSQWLTVPEQSLAEAVNGEIFFDRYGEVTRIRAALSCYPEEIRRKKLAGQLLLMAQSGQYNYLRCIAHGEPAAAQLAAVEFVKSTMAAVFLLSRRYQPYYKWSFRAMRALPELPLLALRSWSRKNPPSWRASPGT